MCIITMSEEGSFGVPKNPIYIVGLNHLLSKYVIIYFQFINVYFLFFYFFAYLSLSDVAYNISGFLL